jgi:hypothetical protein
MVFNIFLTAKLIFGDFREEISLILRTVGAAKFSSRAFGLQSPQSADFIFHKRKFGFGQKTRKFVLRR